MSLLFMDSSAIAKLFLNEEDSKRMMAAADEGPVVCSAIAYVEVIGLLTRACRVGRINQKHLKMQLGLFKEWWETAEVIAVSPKLLEAGGAIAIESLIRGVDGLHLATALHVKKVGAVTFACFDKMLTKAAYDRGFEVFTVHDWLTEWDAGEEE
jgi:predicted nucleic acid-binding protein